MDKSYKFVSTVLETFTADFKCLKLNETTVYVAQGDLSDLRADAIVVFQDSTFSVKYGIAEKLAKLSDNSYSDALPVSQIADADIGCVLNIKASGDLSAVCNNVIYAVVLKGSSDETPEKKPSTEKMKKTIRKILAKSEELKVVTLGVSLFEFEGLYYLI